MKWSLGRILYVTMLCCLLFGIVRVFGSEQSLEYCLMIFPLAVTSVGAYFSKKWRKELLGYAVFGWAYLVFITVFNFTIASGNYAVISFAFGMLTALTVRLIPSE